MWGLHAKIPQLKFRKSKCYFEYYISIIAVDEVLQIPWGMLNKVI